MLGPFLFQSGAHGVGAGFVVEKPDQSFEMMVHAIGTAIELADIDTQRLQEPFRYLIRRMMPHIFVDVHVPFHGMRAQRMGHHDVVDIVVRTFDPVVQSFQTALGFFIGNGCDPGQRIFQG